MLKRKENLLLFIICILFYFCVFQNNILVGSVVIFKLDLISIFRCECDLNSEVLCSSDTDCLNRMLMYECYSSVCQCGEKCYNQRFQRREYLDCISFKTEGRGWGLRINVDIKKVEILFCCKLLVYYFLIIIFNLLI